MSSCQVTCSGTGLGAAWHLDYILVTNSSTGASTRFTYREWFDDAHGWAATLFAEGEAGAKVRQGRRGQARPADQLACLLLLTFENI